jgi:predicted PurR-regulated permease PerM
MADETAAPDRPVIDASDDGDEDLVPGWLDRIAAIGWRVLVTVALLVVIAGIIINLATMTGAILVGLVVTATVYPLVRRLRDRGWPRARAAGAVSMLALVVVVVAILVIVFVLVPFVVELLQSVHDGVAALTSQLADLGLPESVHIAIGAIVDDLQDWLLRGIQSLIAPIAGFVTVLILGGFLTFYLLEDGDRAWVTATKDLDDWRARALTGSGLVALEQVGGYLRGTTVMATIDAVTNWAFLILLGVPLAGPLGVVVFIGGFVPYLGGIVTTAVIVLVTLATQGTLAAAVLLALVVAVNFLAGKYVAPRAYGTSGRVPPALAVIAIPFGAALFGVLGLFATVPVIAAIYAFAPAVIPVLGTAKGRTSSSPLVPLWLDRLGQVSWRMLIVFGLVWLVTLTLIAPLFTGPIVLALLASSVLSPVVDALRQRGLSPTVASLAVTAASIVAVIAVLAITIASLADSASEVMDTAAIGAGNLNVGSMPVELVRHFGLGIVGTVASVVANLAGIAAGLLLAILLIFFFMRDGGQWWRFVLERVDPRRRDRIGTVGYHAVDILRGTTAGTTLSSLAGAALQFITMWVLGLPLAFPISVLMFFGGFIPYIGSAIVTLLGFLVAVAVGDTIDIILMAIFTIVFNIVQGNIVAPLVYGKTVSVHPAVVLLAAPAGGAIGGILGMVMIVPILAIVSRTWRIVIHLFDPEEAQPGPTPVPAPVSPAEPVPPRSRAPAPGVADS